MPRGEANRKGLDSPMAKYPELHDPEWLRARYVDERLSADEIAELVDFDCSRQTVLAALDRHGIPRRAAGWPTRESRRGRAKWESC